MKVLDVTEVRLEWSDLSAMTHHPEPQPHRSPGVHVSGVLRYVAKELAMWGKEDADDEMPLRILLGLGFEQQASRLYEGMTWQPGEVERDGIIGSPDGISLIDDELVIEEFKYSGKSLRVKGGKEGEYKNILTEWMWIQQISSYCALHDGQPRLGRLHVCWKYGAYSYPLIERYFRYLIGLTDEDVERTWMMLQKYKEVCDVE